MIDDVALGARLVMFYGGIVLLVSLLVDACNSWGTP